MEKRPGTPKRVSVTSSSTVSSAPPHSTQSAFDATSSSSPVGKRDSTRPAAVARAGAATPAAPWDYPVADCIMGDGNNARGKEPGHDHAVRRHHNRHRPGGPAARRPPDRPRNED